MKKFLSILVLTLLCVGSFAYDFEVDGKYYYIKSAADKTVVLTYNNYASGKYSGDFVIPETVTYNDVTFHVIGCDWDTFRECDITAIHIPKGFTSFDYNYTGGYTSVFYSPNQVIKVYVPNLDTWMNITQTKSSVFGTPFDLYVDNILLENLVIPDGITTIGNEMFGRCSSIKTVKLANSVKTIRVRAFDSCQNLEKVECNNGLVEILDEAFDEDVNLKEINIPNSVTKIRHHCFRGCTSLGSITIPEGISIIYGETFKGCSQLREITLPSTLTKIGGSAFYDCSSLEDIYINNPTPPLCDESNNSNTIFYGVDKFNCKIHVPQGSVDLYKNANGWNQFLNIIENTSEPSVSDKCATPTISYHNGKLTFNSDTEGAICHSTVTDDDIKSYDGNEIQLGVTYNISVYATKDGYENSDVATATLCWIDVEPKTEGVTDGIAQMPARAVMVKAEGGRLIVEGAEDNTIISAYSIDGVQVGTTTSRNGVASIYTAIPKDSVAIVKIGNKSVKVMMK